VLRIWVGNLSEGIVGRDPIVAGNVTQYIPAGGNVGSGKENGVFLGSGHCLGAVRANPLTCILYHLWRGGATPLISINDCLTKFINDGAVNVPWQNTLIFNNVL